MAAEMEFRLLGPLQVRRNAMVVHVPPGKQQALLATLLLSAGRVVRSEELIDALWGPQSPPSARASLHNCVMRLRRSLTGPGPSRIVTYPDGYLIRVGEGELDVDRLVSSLAVAQEAARAGSWAEAAAQLRTALSQWRGRPLSGVSSDALALLAVPRLTEMCLQALEARIEADLHLGRQTAVIVELRQLIAEHPLRERLHGQLMLALYRNGQQADALAAYHAARGVLVSELGTEPGRELRQLQQQILTADPGLLGMPTHPAVARQAQLPANVGDFTGRAEQVAELCALLTGSGARQRPGAVVILAVTGTGGIGKTTLAMHAAHKLASHFPDGQLYLNLNGAGQQPVSTADALARILRDLGMNPGALPADEAERTAAYRSLIAGRKVLLVLDDARDAAQVRPLLPGSAGCAVLVTSRNSLADLQSARLLQLRMMIDHEAAALFAGIVGRARAEAEPDSAREILAACGGLPLAIRIAAARLATRPGWSLAAMAARLGDIRCRLDELKAGDLAVRASFVASYASLQPTPKGEIVAPDRAFRLCGLAEGPDISLPAAAALLDAAPADTERALELLADASLIQTAAPGRYQFHDLLKVFAAECALAEEDQAERGDAVRRMLSWYLVTAAAAVRVINPHRRHVVNDVAECAISPLVFATYSSAKAWLEAELANLLQAVEQAAGQGEHEIAWKLTHELWDLFNLGGHSDNWIRTHATGLASARQLGDKAAEVSMLKDLAASCHRAGQSASALGYLREALVIARADLDHEDARLALVNIGLIMADLGTAEAMDPLQEAIGLCRLSGNRRGEALAQCGIGAVHGQHGTLSEAIWHYEQGLRYHRQIKDYGSVSEVLVEMGQLRLRQGQFDAAIRDAAEAARLSHQAGYRENHAKALTLLGRAHRELGGLEAARTYWQEAIDLFTQLGHSMAAEVTADLEHLPALITDAGSHSPLLPQTSRASANRP